MSNTTTFYSVHFNNLDGIEFHFSHSVDCEGALQSDNSQPVAIFKTRNEAQKAIRITTAYERLLIASGKCKETDFCGNCRQYIKIRKCELRTP